MEKLDPLFYTNDRVAQTIRNSIPYVSIARNVFLHNRNVVIINPMSISKQLKQIPQFSDKTGFMFA